MLNIYIFYIQSIRYNFFFLLMSIFIKSILQIFPYLLFGIYLYSRYGSNRPIKSIHADRSVAGETSCMQFRVCCFFYFYTCIFIETYFYRFVWCAWPLPIWQLVLKASTFCMKSKSCSLYFSILLFLTSWKSSERYTVHIYLWFDVSFSSFTCSFFLIIIIINKH